MQDEDGAWSIFGNNYRGDVERVQRGSYSNGRYNNRYAYDAFGNYSEETDSPKKNPFRYCGEYTDDETGLIYLRNRYYDPAIGRFITEDPAKDGLNWYAYCGNNPVNYVDSLGLGEKMVVAGGAYHEGNGNDYQYTFVDCALKQIQDIGGATLFVADAGWKPEEAEKIVAAAQERGIAMFWFDTTKLLVNYINNGRDRTKDPISAIYVFAHGTDNNTGKYALTFGLYTKQDLQLRMYTADIDKLNRSSFASNAVAEFYACRTGNDFNNGNFASRWMLVTGCKTYAFGGANGRTDYSDILGTLPERKLGNKKWIAWNNKRGNVTKKPGEAFQLPKASRFSSMKVFVPPEIRNLRK